MNKKFNLIKFYNNCLDDFFVGLKEILFYYWGCRINFGRPAGNKCYNPQMAPKYFLQTQGIIRWKNILIHWVCLFPSNTRYYKVKNILIHWVCPISLQKWHYLAHGLYNRYELKHPGKSFLNARPDTSVMNNKYLWRYNKINE